MQTVNDIRSTFLNYFAKNNHEVIPSSPLVPRNDPTLMFTNAGMAQFKNVFTGNEKRSYSRATTSQKCVRAGGKHNDLDNVGYTARHHTFFEMLGNFSFGDYFKEGAIEFAWDLITKEYGLATDRLMVTVYHTDDEAFDLWRKISGLPEQKIVRIATTDNFWSMGDTGPCGPCSEIFYDHGAHIPGAPPGSPGDEGDRFIEIWNLVFMQYEQLASGERIALPRPSIDTGMGLERLAALLQGKHDNYDSDLMRILILASAEASGTDPDGPYKMSHRIIADHLRSSSFLIADGVLPSNEGRGYVLRRIMRRAMRHAHLMGCHEPLLYKLVPALLSLMGQVYPELVRARPLITETLRSEETRFKQTLERGLRLLDEETAKIAPGSAFPGEIAFKLYDTYGFPLDLTEDALRSRKIAVDTDAFNAAMQHQREEARRAWAGSGEAATETVWFEMREKFGATEFLGYETEHAEGKIQALLVDGEPATKAQAPSRIALIANQTPFYGESGGQTGDTGVVTIAGNARIRIDETQKKLGDLIVHIGQIEEGTVSENDTADFIVAHNRRSALRAHHSATHLLHAALRHRLGEHVTQKGSLVAPDRLRFDISHPMALSAEDISAVEHQVNAEIRENLPVITRLMMADEAIEAGAMALFGEKYGAEVRVVSMGENSPVSVELCGGTHVRHTGDIGLFKIVNESAVAAGVRRIEAVTADAAEQWVNEQQHVLSQIADVLKTAPSDIPQRIAALLDDRRKLERDLIETRKRLAAGGAMTTNKTVAGITFVARQLDDVPARDLKGMADEIKIQIGSGVIVLASVMEGKVSLVVGVTDDLTERFNAVELVRSAAAVIGGKGGGGRPDMAQAGGPETMKIGEATAIIESILEAS